ncbi:MAG: xanthine dehydrogenase family protein molybdopterin-binding subunit, partial [Verrucomicrobiota bacterium]
HHALSAALWGQVTFKGGVASARNFSNYRVMVLNESPVISVDIIESGAALGGVGEPGVPGIAPAVANAYARLTGTRVRSLPFFPGATMSDG